MNVQNQQQTTKEQEVTKQEALVLIKNMLRISISTICYMRDIFPIDCYKNKQYGSVEIHQLQGAAKNSSTGEVVVTHPEAFLVTQWLEKGVFAALEKEFLSSVTFAIFGKHSETGEDRLLESYDFRISYDNTSAKSQFKLNDVDIQSKETVKAQAAQFIRSLTEFVATLDIIPQERWITIQLKYRSQTPGNYEPEFFCNSDSSLFEGQTTPLIVNVGQVSASNISLKLKYAGLESLFEEELSALKLMDTAQQSIFIASTGDDDKTMIAENVLNNNSKLNLRSQVLNYITSTNCTIMTQCSADLLINMKDIRSVFQQLEQDGILLKKGRTYYLAHSPENSLAAKSITTMVTSNHKPSNFEAISMQPPSQSSDNENSKRARRYSVIKEPIKLEPSIKRPKFDDVGGK